MFQTVEEEDEDDMEDDEDTGEELEDETDEYESPSPDAESAEGEVRLHCIFRGVVWGNVDNLGPFMAHGGRSQGKLSRF